MLDSAKAMHSAPRPLITQAMGALMPSGARLTGSRKMPDPITVPTTIALVITRPIERSSDGSVRLTPELLQLKRGRANQCPCLDSQRLGDPEVLAKRGQLRPRQRRRPPVSASGLRLKLRDVLAVVIDHV